MATASITAAVMMMTGTTIAIMIATKCVTGTTGRTTIFLPAWPNATGFLQDSKNSCGCEELFRPACGKRWSPVLKNWSGGYLRLPSAAPMW